MGSCSDMAATNRAAAVLAKAPADCQDYPFPDLKRLVGQTVTIREVGLSSEHTASLSGYATLVTAGGEEVIVDLGTVAELADEGVCGYALQEYFEPDVLRPMIEAAIADGTNGLDDDSRESLREDLELL